MVTILFAGVTLKHKTKPKEYLCIYDGKPHKPLSDGLILGGEMADQSYEKITIPVSAFSETGTAVYDLAVDENGNIIDPLPSKWTDATKATHEEFYIDTLPKQSYIQFNDTGTSIYNNGVEVALRRKNGSWKVTDSRKALEVMYQNIYTRDSIRRSR